MALHPLKHLRHPLPPFVLPGIPGRVSAAWCTRVCNTHAHPHTHTHSDTIAACALKQKLFHSVKLLWDCKLLFDPLGWKVLYQCIIINDNKLFLRQRHCFASHGAEWARRFLWAHPKCKTSPAAGQPEVSTQDVLPSHVHFTLLKHCSRSPGGAWCHLPALATPSCAGLQPRCLRSAVVALGGSRR